MRGVTKHGSMQSWLKSPAPGRGGGGSGKFLSGWKDFKKGTGSIDTWMHTKTLPMTVWRHPFPMLIEVEDKQTREKVLHVWSRQHTCHETEDVLSKLYWREEKGVPSSARTAPPERCAMCKLAEWLWQQSWAWVESHVWDDAKKAWREAKRGAGAGVDPCTVLFAFKSDASESENTTIHVGGFCGLFGRDELPSDLTKAMAHAKIRVGDAWKENCMVKAKSVICVVDNDKPDRGVQISEETKELGEKIKEEIVRVLKSLDVDIQREPYCIRWEYDRSKNMGKQYSATAMMKIKPDARILKLIRSETPDLSSVETPFNQTAMRAIFERHCLLGKVPWDDIFPSEEQEKQWAEEDAQAEADDEALDAENAADDSVRGVADRDADVEGDDPAGDDEDVACDACGEAMKISASKCPHCGHVYDVEAEPKPEPEKPRMRSRAEAAKAVRKPPPAAASDDDQDSEIPF